MIKKRYNTKHDYISKFHEMTLSNMELRNKIHSLEIELESLRANIKNDIDNIKYVMEKNTKIFNAHTHVKSKYSISTFVAETPMQLIK